MAEQSEEGSLGLGIARVEGAHRSTGIPARVFEITAGWKTRPPFLRFLAGHNRPTDLSDVAVAKADGLGVGEDSGLDGFVFAWCGHGTLGKF